MNEPTIMFIRVSENCNSGCFMCRFAKTSDAYNITIDQFEQLISEMKKQKTYKMIRFTGGEPLLHPNLMYFIKRSKEEGFITSIITNGSLLSEKNKNLIDAGLDQCICSLDGSCSKIHDKLRSFPGCFNAMIKGIKELKSNNPKINLRVNTVVSSLNVKDLMNILKLLRNLNIDQWSIIPIRFKKNLWDDGNMNKYIVQYKRFKTMTKNIKKPYFMGYSRSWAGRTSKEIDLFFNNCIKYKPRKECHLVDKIRFYIPNFDLLVPCNCVCHRIDEIKEEYDSCVTLEEKANKMREWLIKNGPNNCTGCEPLNAYLGEHPNILDKNVFLF